ncbi:MAG: LacI family DNA-binding transcriptional regulator [Lachnospiraceae bacterium]|nr:LacI family DNA-binding transcriptional regulator [Lachnospiraceae bacterium]
MSTLKKIAEKAGVSESTVSRVLNNPNYRCSSPEKRNLIWKTAIDMNYVPNEAARNLKMGVRSSNERTCSISVLMTRTEAPQTDPFFSELLRIVETEIHSQFCILSNVWYMPVLSNERKCRAVNLDQLIDNMVTESDVRIDGLVVIGKCAREALVKLKKKFKNVVSINRNPTNHDVDEVTCDGSKVAELAVEHLISLGHTDIGYIGECHNEARYRGYMNTLTRHQVEFEPAYVVETRQTEEDGYEAMKKMLQSDAIPTGIYCANDITAIGVLKCLGRAKNRYFSISVVSSDDIEQAQYTTPMLTTVALPKEEMGKFAVYLLVDRIKGNHKNTVKMELEGCLIKRGSCKPLMDSSWSDYSI